MNRRSAVQPSPLHLPRPSFFMTAHAGAGTAAPTCSQVMWTNSSLSGPYDAKFVQRGHRNSLLRSSVTPSAVPGVLGATSPSQVPLLSANSSNGSSPLAHAVHKKPWQGLHSMAKCLGGNTTEHIAQSLRLTLWSVNSSVVQAGHSIPAGSGPGLLASPTLSPRRPHCHNTTWQLACARFQLSYEWRVQADVFLPPRSRALAAKALFSHQGPAGTSSPSSSVGPASASSTPKLSRRPTLGGSAPQSRHIALLVLVPKILLAESMEAAGRRTLMSIKTHSTFHGQFGGIVRPLLLFEISWTGVTSSHFRKQRHDFPRLFWLFASSFPGPLSRA